jgi:octaprenyl-diphosphate synthase
MQIVALQLELKEGIPIIISNSGLDTPLSLNSSSTAAAFALIADDMLGMDAVVEQRLSSDVPLIGQISRYIVAAGGKRLRPALLLLMCGALGYKGDQRFNLAAVVEFIHTATLLHDDVVDESTLRRGRETANEVFGNPASVLVGDFLYSRAFQMMVDAGDMRIMRTLSEATNVIAEGEVQQLMNMHDASLSEEDYVRVIRSKTAKLFEACARIAALLSETTPAVESACAEYGQALGTAFQVIDDVLDYDGDVSEMGKNLGDDLREGKVTLPLIIAMQRGTQQDRDTLRLAIETGGTDKMAEIVAIVQRTGALDATRNCAAAEAQRAMDALGNLPENDYRAALMSLASQLLVRRA